MKHFRKMISITLAMMLGLTGVVFSGVLGSIDVAATGVACSAGLPFEVSVVTSKDVYTLNACYATFDAAQAAMKTLSATTPNVVVRHNASLSPSKVISMDRGTAVTYDFRTDNTLTVNLYPTYNPTTLVLGGTSTYTTNHRDMQYLGTMGYNQADGTGIIKIKISGFVGYINLLNSDLIPMSYIENGWTITLGGSGSSPYVEAPFTMLPKMTRYIVKADSYTDSANILRSIRVIYHEYTDMYNGNTQGFVYGPAPNWLPNGVYYSWDGITYYTDRDCHSPVYNAAVIGRYYQYFQYLPLQTETNYTAAEIDSYVSTGLGFTRKPASSTDTYYGSMLFGEGGSFISSQNTYGLNALLVFSLAYHESGGGTSSLAINYYNLFGWGAVDSAPGNAEVFASISQSINEMMGNRLRGYLSYESWRFFGSVFGSKNSGMNVKYASDLFWAEKIAARAYRMDRWLGGKDINTINYAIMNDGTTLGIERNEGVDTTDLYTTSNLLKDQSIILKPGNRIAASLWSKTPTTVALDTSGNPIQYATSSTQLIPYDRTRSTGFIPLANYNYMVPRLVDGASSYLVETFGWNTNKLSIAGYGFVNGYNLSHLRDANHFLTLTSTAGKIKIPLGDGALSEQLTTTYGKGIVMYDGTTYSSPTVDISTLEPGNYTLGIVVTELNYGVEAGYPFNYAGTLPVNQIINGKLFAFERLSDGNVKLNVTNAIIIAPYNTAPTNQDITVTASVITGTLNATSHTFTENGSFKFLANDGLGGVAERIITISNIDKVAPIITIATYPTEIQDTSLTVSATTNEGTLNAASHTFQYNGSFNFIATDAVGNVTTKTVAITNINKLLPVVKVTYSTHVQNIGWQTSVSDGAMSGTSGQAFRLEAINIQVTGNPNLGITYSTHVQNIGWQTSVSNGVNSGTLGQSLRLEAIKIELTGSDAINYDVYYRVHAQNFGWLDWAMNGKAAGTEGYSYRLEAINIIIVPKGKDMGYATIRPFVSVIGISKVTYRTHVQNVGWQAIVKDGAMSGTSGQSLRLEGIEIKLGPNMPSGSITYATHVQDYGWMTPVSDGAMSGTSGQSKRLEAIQISLSGEVSALYDVYYRVHAQNFGWLDWAMNGASAGTAGYGYRLEAIEIVMVLKGGAAPGSTTRPFIQK